MNAHELLGGVPPLDLAPTRVALHWAAQLAAAPGHTLVPPRDDVSQSSLHVLPELDALVGEPFDESGNRAVSLLIREFALEIEQVRLPLAGRPIGEALDWLRRAAVPELATAGKDCVVLPGFDLPPHPAATGAPFERPDPAALDELARWFRFAAVELAGLRSATPGASAVRCWPHHFDTAVVLHPAARGAVARPDDERSIGVGMSPGDGTFAQPYFYATPWPPPAPERLPRLEGPGEWHAVEWTGAVLTGEEVVAEGDSDEQIALVRAFLGSAIDACRAAIE
jgi:hypothetical protein